MTSRCRCTRRGPPGLPKGVLTTQRNLAAAYLSADVWPFDSRSVSLTPLPMFHIGGIGWAYLGLVNGATTILVSEFDAARGHRPARARAGDQRRVRPDDPADAGRASRVRPSVTTRACGRSRTAPRRSPRRCCRAALRTFRCPLFGVYGLTETTGGVVQLRPEDHDADGARQHLLRSGGTPAALGRDAHRRPGAAERECGAGDVGEVWLRAPNVMAGYYDRPAETAAALDARRVAAHRRRRLPRRGRLPVPDRPDQGHDRERRGERLSRRGRGGARPAPRRRRCRRDRRSRRAVGRDGHGARRPGAPGRPSTPTSCVAFAREKLAGYKLPRSVEFVAELPAQPRRQGAQARAARPLRGAGGSLQAVMPRGRKAASVKLTVARGSSLANELTSTQFAVLACSQLTR